MSRETFFETYKTRSKTFLLYGNLNDIYFSEDLRERYFEDYLLTMLKDRGYEHVIFYANSGTKGGFCLDEDSADFFMGPNNGNVETIKKAERHPPAVAMLRGTGRRASAPGVMSGGSENHVLNEQSAKEKPEKAVEKRYAYKGKILSEFVSEITPKMRRKDSCMAVVFCNIFNNSIEDPVLRESMLNDWEKYQEDGADNICILLATEAVPNPQNVIRELEKARIDSKFVYTDGTEHYLIPTVCFNVGLPGVDEIEYYLKRLYRGGLLRDERLRPRFRYRDISVFARNILYASKQYNSGLDGPIELRQENLRDIVGRIEHYFKENITKRRELSEDVIRDIWEIRSNAQDYLEELQRPGWEGAANLIKSYQKDAEENRKKQSSRRSQRDIVVERFETTKGKNDKKRLEIPNFVLLGNPGTGKTTIARLMGNILHEWNYLRVGHVVEVTKRDLTSSYVAGIPHATMECVNQAEEGVLFIDEAHLIANQDGGVNNSGSGKEIVSTLNAALTNPNHHFSLVLAGYEDEMQKVFDLDPGFRSRFGDNVVVIQDYKPELLKTIMLGFIAERNFILEEQLTKQLQDHGKQEFPACPLDCFVKKVYDERDREKFGNARDMIAIANSAMKKCRSNVLCQRDFYNGQADQKWFTTEDVKVSLDWIKNEIDSKMKGMDKIKEVFDDLSYEIQECYDTGGDIADLPIRGMILVGNPGTGKTTVAGLLGRLYHHFGILGTAKVIYVSASKFASSYKGGSQQIVEDYIRQAQNKKAVLFVDEAHQLTNPSFDGLGALQSFMSPTTDREHPFMAVFAVYPDKLNDFLSLDPGLTSRMKLIPLEDYTPEQLYEILMLMMDKEGHRASAETGENLKRLCADIYRTRTSFTGNARRMQRLLEDMNVLRRRRCYTTGIDVRTEPGKTFIPDDIPE